MPGYFHQYARSVFINISFSTKERRTLLVTKFSENNVCKEALDTQKVFKSSPSSACDMYLNMSEEWIIGLKTGTMVLLLPQDDREMFVGENNDSLL